MVYRKVNGKENEPGDSAYGQVGKSGLPFSFHRRTPAFVLRTAETNGPRMKTGFSIRRKQQSSSDADEIPNSKLEESHKRFRLAEVKSYLGQLHSSRMISFRSRSRTDQVARKVENAESSERTESDGKDAFESYRALAKLKARSLICSN